jgi:AraC family transcriptional regulator
MIEFRQTHMKRSSLSVPQFAGRMPNPPKASAVWGAFSLLMVEPAVHVSMACADHVLGVQLSGTCRLGRRANGHSSEGWCGPGSVQIIPAEMKGTWEGTRHCGVSRSAVLFIPGAFLSRLVLEDWEIDARNLDVRDRFLADDPVIASMLTRLAREAEAGSPFGSLYGESACEFLANHVIRSHSSMSASPPLSAGGLPAHRLRTVVNYIEDNLPQPMSLRQLAAVAGVSARHFERAFRQATGVPPYAYVLKKRVDAARQVLLNDPLASVEEIALRVGFTSGSHLSFAFRRKLGCSPTMFRRLNS